MGLEIFEYAHGRVGWKGALEDKSESTDYFQEPDASIDNPMLMHLWENLVLHVISILRKPLVVTS